MGRELQKKKRKSSTHRVTRKAKKTQKPLLANQLVATHWDRSCTLSQNYARLGLARRLNGATGGAERQTRGEGDLGSARRDLLVIGGGPAGEQVELREARVVRDGEPGEIVRILDVESEDDGGAEVGSTGPYKALDDPLGRLDKMISRLGDADAVAKPMHGSIVKDLEKQAARPSLPKRRKQSEREILFIKKLVEEYGTNEKTGCYEKMARDTRINVMQQSAGDLRKRVKKYLKGEGGDVG